MQSRLPLVTSSLWPALLAVLAAGFGSACGDEIRIEMAGADSAAGSSGVGGGAGATSGVGGEAGSVASSGGSIPCEGTSLNCNGLAADGCEVDPASDSANCGACGWACEQGSCVDGMCPPIFVAGEEGARPSALAQDEAALYWTSYGDTTGPSTDAVWRTDKQTGTHVQLISGMIDPDVIAVDDVAAYYAHHVGEMYTGSIATISKAGGAVTMLSEGWLNTSYLAVDGESLYWGNHGYNGGDGEVIRRDKATGTVHALATGVPLLRGVAVDVGSVYWTEGESGRIFRCSKSTEEVTTIVVGQAWPHRITADADGIYWGDGHVVNESVTSIRRAASDGSGVEELATGQHQVHGMAVDSTHVYWVSPGSQDAKWKDGVVARVGKNGGPVHVLAKAEGALALVVDDSYVYWLESGENVIMKLAK